MYSPSSDKRFWSALRGRIDSLLENRQSRIPSENSESSQLNARGSDQAKQLKEDSLLLMRGFDSVSHTLSQLSNNLDNALQGARDLAKPPTLTEIFQGHLKDSESKAEDSEKDQIEAELKKGLKRKFDRAHSSEAEEEESQKANDEQILKDGKLKKAKNLAISMATKAGSLARELKSIKSDLCFMQDRCVLLEEENRRLRDGFAKGTRPDEDDLVRLQMEALLAEKSRLANENANLVRENQCLHQLVEYHQLTSQDLSASYEHLIHGMCLDFSSPPPPTRQGANDAEVFETPQAHPFSFPTSLEECYHEEQ